MTTISKIGTKGMCQFDWGRNHLDGRRITKRQEDEIVGKIIPEDSPIPKAPMPSLNGSAREEGPDQGDSTSNVFLSQGMSNVHQSPMCEIQNVH